MMSTGQHKQIQLYDNDLLLTNNQLPKHVDRSGLDITFEKAWIGYGHVWGFYDHAKVGGVVVTEEMYWSSRFGLMTGDEVARRISVWSNSKPRYVINGQSRDWVKPNRLSLK